MKYKAILFDMDGTLVPMDNEEFTKAYFKILFKRLAKYQFDPNTFVQNMWTGVAAMVRNDGTRTNKEAFWEVFCELMQVEEEPIASDCLSFYSNEFNQAKAFTGDNPYATEAVQLAKEIATQVVLATNPLFPMEGQKTRMSWVGLKEDDFVLVTSYENETFCKPNPNYYLEICKRIGVEPTDCLMIGNDENEDAYACSQIGMDCFLVTDCIIPSKEHPWNGPKGNFQDMIEMLKNLRDS